MILTTSWKQFNHCLVFYYGSAEVVETVKSLNAFTQNFDVHHPDGEKSQMLLKFTA